jgi:RNA polymerase sigma-70 factor (ECF subfamily)
MDITLYLHTNEFDFVQACIKKERWAQKRLYEETYSEMMNLACRYSDNNDDALDILHEAYIKIFNNLYKYVPGTSLSAWMKRIVVNSAIDHYRKEKRRRTDDLKTVEYHSASLDSDAISYLSSKEILLALQQLTPTYRSVFNLYVLEGYSHKEIAKILSITESTCRSNLVKARQKLQHILHTLDIKRQ